MGAHIILLFLGGVFIGRGAGMRNRKRYMMFFGLGFLCLAAFVALTEYWSK
jgi:hypothetical protein